jgi:hypothetical protein
MVEERKRNEWSSTDKIPAIMLAGVLKEPGAK